MRRLTDLAPIATGVLALIIVANTWDALAYDVGTHALLTGRAVDISTLHSVLTAEIGIVEGLDSRVLGQRPRELAADGGRFEDSPFQRVLNHFHNPIASPWSSAGLQGPLGLQLGQSSALWQQNTSQSPALLFGVSLHGGEWSWQITRQRFLASLTGAQSAGRERSLADVFRGLGHLMHLVQDASVPAHVRNDRHLSVVDNDSYETWAERQRQNSNLAFIALLQTPRKPTDSVFTPTSEPLAPVPIARLIDTDKYLGTNASVLTGLDIGLAEYTNGNFVSGDTRFPSFALPSEPDVATAFLERSGQGQRRYFPKRLGEGESIQHLVAEGALFKHLRSEVGTAAVKGYILDDKVHTDYASLLLPRAVGYSAALLDYFFRGRLDVKLTPDPDDPTNPNTVILSGINASPEALVSGRIALYADDKVSGQRFEAVAVDSTDVAAVPSGAALPRMKFVVPADAERFMAVYRGTLGDEMETDSFPGAVIGKALGGVRVEEVFNDGATWKLRTPAGVFDSPLSAAEFEVVKWGDDNNTVVARSPVGVGQPNRIISYVVKRLPGSASFELDADAGPNTIKVQKLGDVVFPFGLDIGVAVDFEQSITYNQVFPRVERTLTGDGPLCGNVSEVWGEVSLQVVNVASAQAAFSFPITLDADRQQVGGPTRTPYVWSVEDIAIDRNGRMLAVIAVTLTDPGVPPTTFTRLTVGADGGLVPVNAPFGVTDTIGAFFPFFPGIPLLWALVDVSAGTVVATTAEPVIAINAATNGNAAVLEQGLWVHTTMGNPDCGSGGWGSRDSLPGSYKPTMFVDIHMPNSGSLSVTGVVRSDLADALRSVGFVDAWQISAGPEQAVEFLTTSCNNVETCQYRVFDTSSIVREPPQFDVRRVPATNGGERLVLFVQDYTPEAGTLLAVAAWDPAVPAVKVAFSTTASADEFFQLGAATSSAALLSRTAEFGDPFSADFRLEQSTTVVLLDTPDKSIVVPDVDLTDGSYVVLGPSYLYNVGDLRFYSASPSLQQTSLPARLADAGGNPIGDYHLITLP
jgi:hypothetical protein